MDGTIRPATLVSKDQVHKLQTCNKSSSEWQKTIKTISDMTPIEYKHKAFPNPHVGPYGEGKGHKEITGDGEQVYLQTLMYIFTKNEIYAKNALQIMQGWAETCTSFEGSNAPLEIGWALASMAKGAELLRYVYAKWDKVVEQKFISFVDKVFLPKLQKKLGWTNNWQITICEARLQYALFARPSQSNVLLNEIAWCQKEFQRIMDVFVRSSGQTDETTRDMIHAQFGIGGLVQICEIFWHQGIKLYDYKDNLLSKVAEYHASILNGNTPKEVCELIKDNWFIPCGWEIVLHHYQVRCKHRLPQTDALLKKKRPCKYTFHWGGDTCTHYMLQ